MKSAELKKYSQAQTVNATSNGTTKNGYLNNNNINGNQVSHGNMTSQIPPILKNKNYIQNHNHSHIINHNSQKDDSRNFDSPNMHNNFHNFNHSVDYSYQGGGRNLRPQASRSFRAYPNQLPQGSLEAYIHLLQEELQNTTYNYQSALQSERKNASQRSDFLLYLIQSLKIRHVQQLEGFKVQLLNAQNERQQSRALQNQMKNIGQGVQQVHEQSIKLKNQNQQLQRQLSQQEQKQKELDEQIQNYHKQIQQCRNKIDQWQRAKLKWNRQRKDLIQMIQQTQRVTNGNINANVNGNANQKIVSRGSYGASSTQQERKQSHKQIIYQKKQQFKEQPEQNQYQNKNRQQLQQQQLQSQNQLQKELMEYNNQMAQSGQYNNKPPVCPQTGHEEEHCQHCRENNFEALFSKYKAQD